MKRIIKRTLQAIAILLLLLLLMAGGYYLKIRSEIKKMSPAPTKEMVIGTDTIYSINDSFVNMYLVQSMGEYTAFDAGNDIGVIRTELGKLNINPEKVKALFLTHTDGDHVAAISLFKNAKLYFSKDEEQMINGQKHRFFIVNNKIPTTIYSLLNDGQAVVVQRDTITGIATPGHSPGSMSYLVDGKFMFTGDALSVKNGKVEEFNPFFCSDLEMLRESLKKLAKTEGPEYIFTAHYGIHSNYKEAMEPWRK